MLRLVLFQNLHIAQLAVSLGGVETLVSHPATMTHGPMIMSDQEREAAGIKPGQVRIRYSTYTEQKNKKNTRKLHTTSPCVSAKVHSFKILLGMSVM